MASVAAIGICVTWVTCWRGPKTEPWLTPPCYITALPSVPLMSTETGIHWNTASSVATVLRCTHFFICKSEDKAFNMWQVNDKQNKPTHANKKIERRSHTLSSVPLCFSEFYTFFLFSCMSVSWMFLAWSIFLSFLPFPLLHYPFSFLLWHNQLSSLFPNPLTFTPSQLMSKLLNWPASQAEIEQALFPSSPEPLAQTAKKELKIIEFIRKKDPRSLVFSASRRWVFFLKCCCMVWPWRKSCH